MYFFELQGSQLHRGLIPRALRPTINHRVRVPLQHDLLLFFFATILHTCLRCLPLSPFSGLLRTLMTLHGHAQPTGVHAH